MDIPTVAIRHAMVFDIGQHDRPANPPAGHGGRLESRAENGP